MKNRKRIFNLGFNLFLLEILFQIIILLFDIEISTITDILLHFISNVSTILMIYPGIKLYLFWINAPDSNVNDDDNNTNDEILDN